MGLKPSVVHSGRQVVQVFASEQVEHPWIASVQFLQAGSPTSKKPVIQMQRPPERRRFQPSTHDLQLVERGPVHEWQVVGHAAIVEGVS